MEYTSVLKDISIILVSQEGKEIFKIYKRNV